MNRLYLDYAATTPLAPAAEQAMHAWSQSDFGNPSSLHHEGRQARHAVDLAREQFAATFGALFGEIHFTSSGTESAALALIGVALAHKGPRNHILIGSAEHHCVLHQQPLLERLGFRVTLIPSTPSGRVLPDQLAPLLSPDVLIVALMAANNETGAITDIPACAELVHAAGALLFTDAVQTFPHVQNHPADLVSASPHKWGGPKGLGILRIKAGTPIEPLLRGGGQEREMRAGTENVAGIIGAAAALSVLDPHADERKAAARDAFVAALRHDPRLTPTVPDPEPRLPGHAHWITRRATAESVLIRLDRLGISASSGAACSSGSLEPSHVLLACGYSPEEANRGLRFSFGPHHTPEVGRQAAAALLKVLDEIDPL